MKSMPSLPTHTSFVLGAGTWAIVAVFTFYIWLLDERLPGDIFPAQSPMMIAFVSVSMLLALAFIVIDELWSKQTRKRAIIHLLYIVGGVSIYALVLTFSTGFVSVLWIIFVSNAARFFALKYCLVLATLPTLVDGLYEYIYLDMPFTFYSTALYILFNLFALLVSYTLISEQREKEKSHRLLQELEATQALLSATAKRDERLRIARDLHDVVGHHLTALSLQLEVANNTVSGDENKHITLAQSITRLLLSDVRAAVGDMRSETQIDLSQSITRLLEDSSDLKISLHYPEDLAIENAQYAETLFRCVQEALTNTRKHANADNVNIRFERNNDELRLRFSDDGQGTDTMLPGNGLKGMRERIEKLKGELQIQSGTDGTLLTVTLPSQES